MGDDANDILRQAWRELPHEDRNLLKEISADQWQVCRRGLGTYTDELLRSAGLGSPMRSPSIALRRGTSQLASTM